MIILENPTLQQLQEEASCNHISILNLLDEQKKKEKTIAKAIEDEENKFIFRNHDSFILANENRKEKGKKKNRNNDLYHITDRQHGKHRELTRKETELVHNDYTKGVHGAGVWYTSRGKKIVPIVSKGDKTNRNYHKKKYNNSLKEALKDYYCNRM